MAEIERVAPRRFEKAIATPRIDTSDRFLDGLSEVAGVTKGLTESFDASTEKLNIEHKANVEKIAKDRLKQAYNFEQGLDVDDDATRAGKQYHAILSANNAFNTEMDNAMFKASDIAKGDLDAVDVLDSARKKALAQIDPDIVQDSTYNKLMTSMFEKGASRLNSSVQVHKKAILEIKQSNEIIKLLSKKDLKPDDLKLAMTAMDKYNWDLKQQLAALSGAAKADLAAHPENYQLWNTWRPFGDDFGTLAEMNHSVSTSIVSAAVVEDDKKILANFTIKDGFKKRWIAGGNRDALKMEIKRFRNKGIDQKEFGISEAEIRAWDRERAIGIRKRAETEDFRNKIIENTIVGGRRIGEDIPAKEHADYSRWIDSYVLAQPENNGMSGKEAFAKSAKMHSLSLVESPIVQQLRDLSQLSSSEIESFTEESLETGMIAYANWDNAYKAKYFSDKDALVLDDMSKFLSLGVGTTNRQALSSSRKANSTNSASLRPGEVNDVTLEALENNSISEDNRGAYDYVKKVTELMLRAGYTGDDMIQDRISGYLKANTIISEDGESIHIGNIEKVSGKSGMNEHPDKIPFLLEQAGWKVGLEEKRKPEDYMDATWNLDHKTGQARLIYGDGSPSQFDIKISELTAWASAGRDAFINDPDFQDKVVDTGFINKVSLSIDRIINKDDYFFKPVVKLQSGNLLKDGFAIGKDGTIGYGAKLSKNGTVTVDGIEMERSQFGWKQAEMKFKEDMNASAKDNSKRYGSKYKDISPKLRSYLDSINHFEPGLLDQADLSVEFDSIESERSFSHVHAANEIRKRILHEIKGNPERSRIKRRLSILYYNIF